MKSFKDHINETYVYHRSDVKNHESIRQRGLTSKRMVAANGNPFKFPISFASKQKDTDGYADGPSKLYRVNIRHLKDAGKDPFSGYVRTIHDVPPQHIEVENNGKWKKLK